MIFQPEVVMSITNSRNTDTLSFSSAYMAVINAMGSDIAITTDNEMINNLTFY